MPDPQAWISRDEHLRIVEQINRARNLEMSANFESGRRYERDLAASFRTGTSTLGIIRRFWASGDSPA